MRKFVKSHISYNSVKNEMKTTDFTILIYVNKIFIVHLLC